MSFYRVCWCLHCFFLNFLIFCWLLFDKRVWKRNEYINIDIAIRMRRFTDSLAMHIYKLSVYNNNVLINIQWILYEFIEENTVEQFSTYFLISFEVRYLSYVSLFFFACSFQFIICMKYLCCCFFLSYFVVFIKRWTFHFSKLQLSFFLFYFYITFSIFISEAGLCNKRLTFQTNELSSQIGE